MGPLIEAISNPQPLTPDSSTLRVLWITPLRALAADTLASLQFPVQSLGIDWRVEARTGDTTSSARAKQAERMPECLVTTPESLTLMLTREDVREVFQNLSFVVVDEWHELIASKRGVQTELALARIRAISPKTRTWGLSATLGNLQDALETLLGTTRGANTPIPQHPNTPVLITGDIGKEIIIDSILPQTIERFPWAGHFGMQMIPRVVEAIAEGGTCLVFCNTRSQTELWYQAILEARPDWAGVIAIHHGSLDREVRDSVEAGLKQGLLRAVVTTSSLDLGVDFTPVDRVLQVGSPKGVARLLQRAGRSGHQPGVASRVSCVPTHALEMIDIAAARDAAKANRIESREGIRRPLDVLAQHLVTIALGTGFRWEELYNEVRTSHAYADLTPEEWQWTVDFVTRGGSALTAYPEYSRVVLDDDGVYRVKDKHIAHRHRMSIGTITADAAMHVQFVGGGRLGTIEESFLSRLNPGDKFIFSGRALHFVRIKDMTAFVKPAKSPVGAVPRWMGGRIALSGELAHSIREKLEEAKYGSLDSPEMQLLAPLLEVQARWSALPAVDEILIERLETREGHHLFLYPLEGRLVHEGLAALFAYRMSRLTPITFSMACNDYGIELLSPEPAPLDEALGLGEYRLFSPENLIEDIPASLNAAEMAKRQFREIARIAGLVFQGFPGANKSAKQLQASSGLFYDVFRRFDPGNMLLVQANREVLERQLEQTRMAQALERLQNSKVLLTEPPRPTPLAFPILVDRLRGSVTSENITERIQKMSVRLEREADRED
jgi:ATP-dependent helicase Lhr and Lhr-like helicase